MSNLQYAKLFLQDNKAEEKDKAEAVSEIISKELNDILHKNSTPEELRRYVRSPHVLSQWIEKRYRELTNKILPTSAYKIESKLDKETKTYEFTVVIKAKEKPKYEFDVESLGMFSHGNTGRIRTGTIRASSIIPNEVRRELGMEEIEVRGGRGNSHFVSYHHTGTTPTNPSEGDIWTTDGHRFYRETMGTWAQTPEESDSVETDRAEETNPLRTIWNNIWRGWRENQ